MTWQPVGGTLGHVTALDVTVTADNGQVTTLTVADGDVLTALLEAWHTELTARVRGLVTIVDRDGDTASWPAARVLSITSTPHRTTPEN